MTEYYRAMKKRKKKEMNAKEKKTVCAEMINDCAENTKNLPTEHQ